MITSKAARARAVTRTDERHRKARFDEAKARRLRQRQDAKRVTRDALLDAGLDEIIDHGLDAGLEGICARAGYTRGAFYVHFKNREDFLAALAEKELGAIVAASLAAPGGVAASISRFSDALAEGAWPLVPKIRVAAVRMMDAIDRWPAVRASFERVVTAAIDHLAHVGATEQAAGHIRRDVGVRELAMGLVTMALGTIMLTNTSLRIDHAKQRELLVRLIAPALSPDRRR